MKSSDRLTVRPAAEMMLRDSLYGSARVAAPAPPRSGVPRRHPPLRIRRPAPLPAGRRPGQRLVQSLQPLLMKNLSDFLMVTTAWPAVLSLAMIDPSSSPPVERSQ